MAPTAKSNAESNGGPVKIWITLIERVGFPIAIATVFMYMYYSSWDTMQEQQTKLIDTATSTNKSLINATDRMAEAVEGINVSIKEIREDSDMMHSFTKVVTESHEKQIEILQHAEEMMKDVPEERKKQTQLLEEISRKLDPPNNP